MRGRSWLAALVSAALVTVGAAGPARADDDPPADRVWLWNQRSAFGVATTLRFMLATDTAGYPLLDDQNYAAAAEHGLARIDLLVDGEPAGSATAAPWSIVWDPSTHPEAQVRLTVRSYNQAGRSADTSFTTWVDHTAPTLRVAQNGYLKAGGDIYAEAADRFGIGGIDLLSGDRLVESATAPSAILHWDRNGPDGPAKLTVRARDIAGNVAEYRRTVLVDSVRPVVTVAPAAGAYVRGVVPFAITGVRDASGVASFEVTVSGLGGQSGQRVVREDTRQIADGPRAVRWWVPDRAGNVTTVRRTVIVDNHAPAVAFAKAPKNKARVKKTVTVTAKATDRFGLARVQLLVNGKVVATDSKAGYRFTLNPKRYGKKFTVQLRAYDRAGNVKYGSKRTYRR